MQVILRLDVDKTDRTASDVNYWANMIIKEAEAIKHKASRMDWNK
jgi:hypothetical protein